MMNIGKNADGHLELKQEPFAKKRVRFGLFFVQKYGQERIFL